MRRNQFLAFVFASLCCWAGATYYLFLHRPVSRGEEKGVRVEDHLDALEERLRAQFRDNEQLLTNLKRLVQDPEDKEVEGAEAGAVPKPTEETKAQPAEAEAEAETGPKAEAEGEGPEGPEGPGPAAEDNEVPEDEEGHRPPQPAAQPALTQLSQEEMETARLRSLALGTTGRDPAVAVLVLACNRPTVRRCLDQLLAYRPSPDRFPIIVSQDCRHRPTSDTIAGYRGRVTHMQQPDQNEIDVPPKEKKFRGYFNIARHYGWALNRTFYHYGFQTAIIIEDDLDVSPDLYEYFWATLPLLRRDRSLWCVSAWNDNGKEALVDGSAPELLHRTDFFPGLGWMLGRDAWAELATKWPASYWDDWIRQPEQRQGRACIRPELSRTRTFGKVGVSNGHFYDKHLKFIKLNDKFVPFTRLDLSYLLQENYDVEFVRRVYDSPVVSFAELKSGAVVTQGSVRIAYHTKDAFKRTAKMLGLMDDFRSGVPRTGYRGIVSFMYHNRRVYLAPGAAWKGYDLSWS